MPDKYSFEHFDFNNYANKAGTYYMGNGEWGLKAKNLAIAKQKIALFKSKNDTIKYENLILDVPPFVVITTEYFDVFMEQNNLYEIVLTDFHDEDILKCFLEARLPEILVEKLKVYLRNVHVPLVVRSSLHFEGFSSIPCSGIYKSKLIPNNSENFNLRVAHLSTAVKYIYASSFFYKAKCFINTTSCRLRDEKMAVIIQELVGQKYQNRFYPNISGLARSYNFYPFGHANPQDGVVNLVLGLGKSITESSAVWVYSPKYPEVNPPFNSVNEMLNQTQVNFWALNMDPLGSINCSSTTNQEMQFLVHLNLKDAEEDETLGYIASTYDYESDQISLGIQFCGSRIINFGPLLKVDLLPINDLIQSLLVFYTEIFHGNIDIEFAIKIDPRQKKIAYFGLLQVNPMAMFEDWLDIKSIEANRIFAFSSNTLGNGIIDYIRDIIYVDPNTFHLKDSVRIAAEIIDFNQLMSNFNITYILIGFGRWGTSDPWLGIPVSWGDICCARVIIEAQFPGMGIDASRGSHFFQQISNSGIFYFNVNRNGPYPIDWDWLNAQRVIKSGEFIKHVRLETPLFVQVDGSERQGFIMK